MRGIAMLDVRTSVPDHAARAIGATSSTHSSRNPEPPGRPNAGARTPPFRSSGETHERPRDCPHAFGMRRAAFHRPDPRARPRHCATTGDRLRRSYAATRMPRSPSACIASRRRSSTLGVKPGCDRGHDGLGQPPLPRMLLRRADDGRGAAHGERADLARADALHDQPRARTTSSSSTPNSCRCSRRSTRRSGPA